MSNNNVVKLEFQTKDKTRKDIEALNRRLKKTESNTAGASKGFRRLAQSTAVIEGPLGGTAGRLSSIASLLGEVNPLTVSLGIVTAAATAAVTASLSAYADYEQQMMRVNGLLKATGFASGLTADQIDDMAKRVGRDTLASAGDVREAAGVLLTFKSISEDTFERTIGLSQDMAAVMGANIKNSALQLAKALEDPVTGLNALRRSGVSFTDAQKDMIKSMVEAGDKADAQRLILETLENQLGGAGAAEGQGLKGSVDLVSESWTNLLESFSKSTGANQVASEFLNRMARGLDRVAEKIDPSIQTQYANNIERQGELLRALNHEIENGIVGNEAFNEKRREELALLQTRAGELRKQIDLASEQEAKAKAGAVAARAQAEADAETSRKAIENKKRLAELDKVNKQGNAEADRFVQRLQTEEQQLQKSFLSREQSERLYHENNIVSLREFRERKFLTESKFDQAVATEAIRHEIAKNDAIVADSKRRADAEENIEQIKQQAISGIASNLTVLMSAQSKKLFKIGKVAAISSALINTSEAITKTMASVPYPFNVPLAIAQGAAGAVQIQNIKRQTFGGGGSIPSVSSSSASTGVGSSAPGLTVPTIPLENRDSSGSISLQLIIQGNVLGNREFIDDELIPGIAEAIEKRDVTIINRDSRQFEELVA